MGTTTMVAVGAPAKAQTKRKAVSKCFSSSQMISYGRKNFHDNENSLTKQAPLKVFLRFPSLLVFFLLLPCIAHWCAPFVGHSLTRPASWPSSSSSSSCSLLSAHLVGGLKWKFQASSLKFLSRGRWNFLLCCSHFACSALGEIGQPICSFSPTFRFRLLFLLFSFIYYPFVCVFLFCLDPKRSFMFVGQNNFNVLCMSVSVSVNGNSL